MSRSGSLVVRAILAVVLTVGFYVLALGVAGLLLSVPYEYLKHGFRGGYVGIKLALIFGFAGLVILWSVIPRPDRFTPPGPRLDPEKEPALFRELESIAASTGQTMPAEVYLVPQVNAFVTERGGMVGVGTRRVMGLGMPLMAQLTVSEFRAVLTHEFGHFHGGDTRLGPWIYRTRGAIGRTLGNLSGGGSGILHRIVKIPFEGYARLFLRVTLAISRRQEFAADRLASEKVGSGPLVRGLRRISGIAPFFGPFWDLELTPVLGAGRRPPLVEGFQRFLTAPGVHEKYQEVLEASLKAEKANPYDSHPSLPERIDAAEAIAPVGEPVPEPPALSLLADPAASERELLAFVYPGANVEEFRPVDWDAVVNEVRIPEWRRDLAPYRARLSTYTFEDIPKLGASIVEFGRKLRKETNAQIPYDSAGPWAIWIVGSAMLLALRTRGWTIVEPMGAAPRAEREGKGFAPYQALKTLAEGKPPDAGWRAFLDETGLASLSIAAGLDEDPAPAS